MLRVKRVLERERFDLIHVHEPMTPVLAIGALALTRSPVVATFHASGDLAWAGPGMRLWGLLLDRIDARIAVSSGLARPQSAMRRGSTRWSRTA